MCLLAFTIDPKKIAEVMSRIDQADTLLREQPFALVMEMQRLRDSL